MFIPYAGKKVGDIVTKGLVPVGGTVVEMGNQSYSIDREAIQGLIGELVSAHASSAVNLEALKEISEKPAAKRPGDPDAPLVADFFKALGFKSYTAIDINTRFGSLVMDLNKDLEATYGFKEQYDLVTNIGVSEHLFDQATFFRNAHKLTKPGGLMLHILPSVNYVNHGFYNYQPVLFFDLAQANGYELLEMKLTDRSVAVIDALNRNEIGTYFSDFLSHLGIGSRGNLFVASLMRKGKSETPFEYPLQGKYLVDIEGSDIKKEYASTKHPRVVGRKGLFDPAGRSSLPARIRRKIKRKALTILRRISSFILRRF